MYIHSPVNTHTPFPVGGVGESVCVSAACGTPTGGLGSSVVVVAVAEVMCAPPTVSNWLAIRQEEEEEDLHPVHIYIHTQHNFLFPPHPTR